MSNFMAKSLTKSASYIILALSAATCLPALAQTRTCIIDEQTGQHRCGWLADEQGYRIDVRPAPAVITAPVLAPTLSEDRYAREQRAAYEREQRTAAERQQRLAYEQQRMQVQEQVNALFVNVLGRDADIVTLRKVTEQVMSGRALADVRIELATSNEAREAVKQAYRDILRREADPSGLNSQLSEIRKGTSLAQVRQAMAESPEARGRR